MVCREELGKEDKICPIGAPAKVCTHTENGMYQIELIQASGDYIFEELKNPRTQVQTVDFFGPGDVFAPEDYGEFFSDGKMDSSGTFGCGMETLNVTDSEAIVCTAGIS